MKILVNISTNGIVCSVFLITASCDVAVAPTSEVTSSAVEAVSLDDLYEQVIKNQTNGYLSSWVQEAIIRSGSVDKNQFSDQLLEVAGTKFPSMRAFFASHYDELSAGARRFKNVAAALRAVNRTPQDLVITSKSELLASVQALYQATQIISGNSHRILALNDASSSNPYDPRGKATIMPSVQHAVEDWANGTLTAPGGEVADRKWGTQSVGPQAFCDPKYPANLNQESTTTIECERDVQSELGRMLSTTRDSSEDLVKGKHGDLEFVKCIRAAAHIESVGKSIPKIGTEPANYPGKPITYHQFAVYYRGLCIAAYSVFKGDEFKGDIQNFIQTHK